MDVDTSIETCVEDRGCKSFNLYVILKNGDVLWKNEFHSKYLEIEDIQWCKLTLYLILIPYPVHPWSWWAQHHSLECRNPQYLYSLMLLFQSLEERPTRHEVSTNSTAFNGTLRFKWEIPGEKTAINDHLESWVSSNRVPATVRYFHHTRPVPQTRIKIIASMAPHEHKVARKRGREKSWNWLL